MEVRQLNNGKKYLELEEMEAWCKAEYSEIEKLREVPVLEPTPPPVSPLEHSENLIFEIMNSLILDISELKTIMKTLEDKLDGSL